MQQIYTFRPKMLHDGILNITQNKGPANDIWNWVVYFYEFFIGKKIIILFLTLTFQIVLFLIPF